MEDKRWTVAVTGMNFPPEDTGIAPYTGALARGLRQHGLHVDAYVAHPHYPEWKLRPGYGAWAQTEEFMGVNVHRLRHYVARRPKGVRRLLSEISLGLRQAATKWGHPDIVIAVSPALFATAFVALRCRFSRRRIPLVIWVQDLYGLGLCETGTGGSLISKVCIGVESWTLRQADRVVVIHERFADYVGDILKVPSGRVEIIRNWAHISDTRAPTDVVSARQLLGWHSTDTIVLHAGSMGAKQGLETIVEAARVADQEQAPVRFILLGDGSERTELMKSARGVSRVQFVDPLDDERYLIALQAADVLLVNSMRGVAEMAVPSKLTSYFSAGRPVVAAVDPSGIAASEIRSANAGVVVPAGEPVELFNAALELRADVERAAALGSNGRQYRERALGQDAALEAWAQLVEKIGRSSAY